MLWFYCMGGTLFDLNYTTKKKKSFTCWASPIPVPLLYFLSLGDPTPLDQSPNYQIPFLRNNCYSLKAQMPTKLALHDFNTKRFVHWSVEGPQFIFFGDALYRLHVFWHFGINCSYVRVLLDIMAQNTSPI